MFLFLALTTLSFFPLKVRNFNLSICLACSKDGRYTQVGLEGEPETETKELNPCLCRKLLMSESVSDDGTP